MIIHNFVHEVLTKLLFQPLRPLTKVVSVKRLLSENGYTCTNWRSTVSIRKIVYGKETMMIETKIFEADH